MFGSQPFFFCRFKFFFLFISGMFDLEIPCNEVHCHLLAKLLDNENSGEIDYTELHKGLQYAMYVIYLKNLKIWLVDGVKLHFQQYFSYIVAASFICGGNRRTWIKPPACLKSLTNF